MAYDDRVIQQQQHERAAELLKQRLTTRQISDRTGMSMRAVLRLKKKLENDDTRRTREPASA